MEGAEQAGESSVSSKPTEETAPAPHSQPKEDTAPTPHSQPTEDPAPTPHSQPTEDTAPTPHSQPTEDTAPTPHSQPTEDTAPTPHSQPTEDTAPAPHSQPKEDTAPAPHSQPKEDTAPTPHSQPKEDTAPTPHSQPKEDTAPTPHSQPKEDTAPTPHSQPTEDTAPTPHSQPTEDTAPTPHSQPKEDPAPTPHSQPTEDTAPTLHSQPKEDTAPTPHSQPTEDTAPTPHSQPTEDTAPTPLPESNNISNHTDKAHSPTDNSTSQITIETEASEDLPQISNGPIVVKGSNKNPASEKLQRVRTWSITKYKVTRQALAERLGRGSKTVDLDLEPRMELLKDDRQRYDHMTKLAQTLATQITQLSVTQKALGDVFADLSNKTPALHAQFGLNAKAQRYLSKSGETLSEAVNSFTSDMNTLVTKTIEDTMINAKQYETVRIEYDAYRVDLEELNLGPRDAVTVPKLEQAQTSFQLQRERYERSRNDLSVKLKLLEENKVKVLHNHLWLLHNAVASHCLNCHRFLQNNMQQAQNMSCPTEDAPSWLEDS